MLYGCNEFISEICLALGLDADGDTFTATNTANTICVTVYVNAKYDKIKVIENNTKLGGI